MPDSLSTETSEKFKEARINSLAVMQLSHGIGVAVDEAACAQLTQALIDNIESNTSYELVNTTAPAEASKVMAAVMETQQVDRRKALEFGKRLGVDGVLFGVINRYSDSSGGRFGSNEPGGASFKLWLLDQRANQILWSATYQESEQPLTENLFRMGQQIRNGIGYRSSAELMANGLNQAAMALERARQNR